MSALLASCALPMVAWQTGRGVSDGAHNAQGDRGASRRGFAEGTQRMLRRTHQQEFCGYEDAAVPDASQ